MRRIGKDFSRRDTPLFPTMLVPAREEELDEAVNEEMYDRLERATTTATSLDAEQDKGGGLKRQDTIGDTIAQTRVESSAKEHRLGKENASKQGRNIANIDVDAEITLVDETVEDRGRYNDQEMFDTDVLNDEEVVVEDVKPKARGIIMRGPSKSLTKIPISSKVQDKGKGAIVEEPLKFKKKDQISFDEQEARRLQTKFDDQDRLAEEKAQQIKDENLAWDNVQAMMDADYELAARLKEEEQGELTIEENKMLKNFNREDLEVLWRLVKDRFIKSKLVDDMDSFLLHTLKTMFEHHVEDTVWKIQQGLTKIDETTLDREFNKLMEVKVEEFPKEEEEVDDNFEELTLGKQLQIKKSIQDLQIDLELKPLLDYL
nr:hypothetical protein [Tanacetum cinerariifolium]